MQLARGLLFPSAMELETALAGEVSRLVGLAETAAREIAARPAWWVAVVRVLSRLVF